MFYVFFDIDGVLNRESDWRSGFTINPECLAAFSALCDNLKSKYGAVRLIASTSWRDGFIKDGKTGTAFDAVLKEGIVLYGVTPHGTNKTRQDEIGYYIRRNNVGKYIVLDDDERLFPDTGSINIFITDSKAGLTMKDIQSRRMSRCLQ